MANYQYLTSNGTIVADTSDIQDTVIGEYQAALGADVSTSPDTSPGALIAQETQSRTDVIENNAAVANQLNPNLSGGIALEGICAWLGLQRKGASFTQVPGVILTGVPNSLFMAGFQGYTEAGDYFASVGAVQLDSSGNATVNFQAVIAGPVPCPAGELIRIAPNTAPLGLETITNPIDGVLGALVQSDTSLKLLRQNTLGLQGISEVEAQVSALNNVDGVTSVSFRENLAPTTAVIDGITLTGHSVWACVDGGSNADIATALLENKTGGAGWNGAVSVPTVEPASGQTYPVAFDRPTYIPIAVKLTLTQNTSTNNLSLTAPQACVDFATGLLDGEQGWKNGINASPFDLASAIVSENPGVRVREVQIAPVSTLVYQTTEIAIALNQRATLNISSITVILE